ncbi:unnamed protein product [Arabis nemorensis]|uniref:Uncharacterized protein n=1 Tax=Arabis nemorensis TaxID=586526 RepID=A0A565B3C8_9BRAS|nr:unnamed protein product [Arabis nemorensis]
MGPQHWKIEPRSFMRLQNLLEKLLEMMSDERPSMDQKVESEPLVTFQNHLEVAFQSVLSALVGLSLIHRFRKTNYFVGIADVGEVSNPQVISNHNVHMVAKYISALFIFFFR